MKGNKATTKTVGTKITDAILGCACERRTALGWTGMDVNRKRRNPAPPRATPPSLKLSGIKPIARAHAPCGAMLWYFWVLYFGSTTILDVHMYMVAEVLTGGKSKGHSHAPTPDSAGDDGANFKGNHARSFRQLSFL